MERKQICGAMGSVATNCSDGLRRYTKNENWLDGPRQDIVRALKECKERPKVDTRRRRRTKTDTNIYLLQHTSYPDYREHAIGITKLKCAHTHLKCTHTNSDYSGQAIGIPRRMAVGQPRHAMMLSDDVER